MTHSTVEKCGCSPTQRVSSARPDVLPPHPPSRRRHRHRRRRPRARTAGVPGRCGRAVGDGDLGCGPCERRHRRRTGDRVVRLGRATRHHDRPPPRRVRARHGGARVRHRPVDLRVLAGLLQPRQARTRPPRRRAHAVRRGDARRRPVGSAHRAVHLLGAHVGHVVPPHRQRRHESASACRRPAGDLHHRCRRVGDARRSDHHRPGRWHLSDLRTAGRSTLGSRGQCRPGAGADRRVHQVGAGPVQQLAAGGHGRADAGECVPALGHDGEGGRLPRGAPRTDVRPHRQLAGARADRRSHHDARRRSSCASPVRPEAAARLRHRQPARVHDVALRRRRLSHR